METQFEPGQWWHQRVDELVKRDGKRCWICELPLLPNHRGRKRELRTTLDHILPKAHGGGMGLDNLKLAHSLCNNRRQHYGITDKLARSCRTAILRLGHV